MVCKDRKRKVLNAHSPRGLVFTRIHLEGSFNELYAVIISLYVSLVFCKSRELFVQVSPLEARRGGDQVVQKNKQQEDEL